MAWEYRKGPVGRKRWSNPVAVQYGLQEMVAIAKEVAVSERGKVPGGIWMG
jgi:hypothetical protein